MSNFLPVLIIVESLCAALVYAYNKDKMQTIYWLSQVAIIYSVTFKGD